MLEAFHMNLQIPEDVSVIGFDDLEMSRHLRPALTTVRVPTESLWSKAAELLLTKLRNEPVAMHTEVEVALVVRESCGPVAPQSASAAS
jgi:LacI family transcriptional regulator